MLSLCRTGIDVVTAKALMRVYLQPICVCVPDRVFVMCVSVCSTAINIATTRACVFAASFCACAKYVFAKSVSVSHLSCVYSSLALQ